MQRLYGLVDSIQMMGTAFGFGGIVSTNFWMQSLDGVGKLQLRTAMTDYERPIDGLLLM